MKKLNIERIVILTLCVWSLLIYALGSFEILAKIPNLIFGAIVITLFIGTSLSFFKIKQLKKFLLSFTLEELTFIHIWRIVAAAVFIHYGSENLLPQQFVNLAGYGDLIAGCMVPIALFFKKNIQAFWIFNIIGFADFLIAVGTGVFFAFSGDEIMLNIRLLPLAMIPLFGVPISGLTHIVMFKKLSELKKTVANNVYKK